MLIRWGEARQADAFRIPTSSRMVNIMRHRDRCGPGSPGVALLCCSGVFAAPALGQWVAYTNESATRISSIPSVGLQDVAEKDYAVGDLDHPMSAPVDLDLVVVRKQPFMTSGGRRNVLFMNVDGVLTDQTAIYISEFLDLTNDRDVVLVDINNDDWLDIVTATACLGCDTSTVVDDARVFLNLGLDEAGDWLGFDSPIVLNDLFIGPGNEKNYCAVAAGDLDGDLNADLYFASYDDDAEDQLLMGDGAGGFTNGNNRLTGDMRESIFGTAVVFADMDNDSDLDIVKSEAGFVEIFRNNGNGVFDLLDPTYSGAAYHVGVGDLNGDGLLDLVISDDGTDRYIINDGNLLDGSPDTSLVFPGSTDGFGSNSYVTDLDGDGWPEVLIADVDVQVPGCTRVSDILRNDAGTFTADTANIPGSALTGVHDFAVLDINNDGLPDIVVGTCDGTQVWINSGGSTPIAIEFSYPGGLPDFMVPQQTMEFTVQIDPTGDTIEPGTPAIVVSSNGGVFVETALTPLDGNLYMATIPAGECTERFDFYLRAQLAGGLIFFDPPSAPGDVHTAFSANGTATLFADAMEGDVSAWTITNDPSLTGGGWEAAIPNATIFLGLLAAPGFDATLDGTVAFVTENGPAGDSVAANWDVDGGPTILTSPLFDLSGNDGIVSYARWVFSMEGPAHDTLVIEISNNDGATWTLVEEVGSTDSSWEPASFIVSDFILPTAQVRIRFSMADLDESVSEAGIDDFTIDTLACGGTPCPWDTTGDGEVGINDFLDLLAAWGPNPGHPADFNGDGIVGINDFLELLANWGQCSL